MGAEAAASTEAHGEGGIRHVLSEKMYSTWAESGKCYHSFVKKHCQKACGLCGDGPKPDCKDKKEKCEEYANAGYCNHSSMKKYCPKSCDLC